MYLQEEEYNNAKSINSETLNHALDNVLKSEDDDKNIMHPEQEGKTRHHSASPEDKTTTWAEQEENGGALGQS